MNWRAIWAIVRKDLMVVRQNKGVLIPLIVVPLLMLVLLPGLAGFAPTRPGENIMDANVRSNEFEWKFFISMPSFTATFSPVVTADSGMAIHNFSAPVSRSMYVYPAASMVSAMVPVIPSAWAGRSARRTIEMAAIRGRMLLKKDFLIA